MARAPAHFDPSKPQHRIPQITQLAPLELEQVPGVPHCRVGSRYLAMASIDGTLHSSRTCGHPLDLWRRIAEQQVSLALIPSLDRLPHDLHVLLRHRLLLEAEIGEGAVHGRPNEIGLCGGVPLAVILELRRQTSLQRQVVLGYLGTVAESIMKHKLYQPHADRKISGTALTPLPVGVSGLQIHGSLNPARRVARDDGPDRAVPRGCVTRRWPPQSVRAMCGKANIRMARPCLICGASLEGRDPSARTCSPSCRREAGRYRAVLSGQSDGPDYTALGLAQCRS